MPLVLASALSPDGFTRATSLSRMLRQFRADSFFVALTTSGDDDGNVDDTVCVKKNV